MTTISVNGASAELWIREIAGTKSYSVDAGANWNALSGTVSVTITNTGAATNNFLRVLFKTDITISDGDFYFICNSNYIQFGSTSLNADGSRPTLTVSGVSSYAGLIANASYSGIRVLNLQMTGTGLVSLTNGAGWFGQYAFGASATGNMFVNCSADENLPISTLSGGIVGANAGSGASARLEIIGCTSAGDINGLAGGIVGQYAGTNGGYVRVTQSSSSGSIAIEGGGIFGKYAGRIGGEAYAGTCYSSGFITSGGGGGIFGSYAGADGGTATANTCYSTGTIGSQCGGIYGMNADSARAVSCYTTGYIFGGGIFGSSYTSTTASNCYTAGPTGVSPTSGIYAGDGSDGASNYSEANNGDAGTWNSTNAGLAGITTGGTWISTGVNTPYLFSSYGYTPYQINNINFDSSGSLFYTSFDASATPGSSTDAAIAPPGYTYEIIDSPSAYITIDASTGAIIVGSGTELGTYTLTIYSHNNPYAVTTYTLTVNASSSSGAASGTCCGSLAGQSNLDYATIFQVKGGNALIATPSNKFTSYQDMFRFKTALAFHRS